jgi:calcineurin-like phosphoesterase family protein
MNSKGLPVVTPETECDETPMGLPPALSAVFKNQNTLFSLGMLTYTYERQDIIQIVLERLPGEGEKRSL